jgi:hypothetical protein
MEMRADMAEAGAIVEQQPRNKSEANLERGKQAMEKINSLKAKAGRFGLGVLGGALRAVDTIRSVASRENLSKQWGKLQESTTNLYETQSKNASENFSKHIAQPVLKTIDTAQRARNDRKIDSRFTQRSESLLQDMRGQIQELYDTQTRLDAELNAAAQNKDYARAGEIAAQAKEHRASLHDNAQKIRDEYKAEVARVKARYEAVKAKVGSRSNSNQSPAASPSQAAA